MPGLRDCFYDLKGCTIFSQIDLKSGYYQILMDKESIPLTSFVLPFGQFEFLRMPFGLSNTPGTFQRAMNLLLGNLDFVKIYLDDILIASKDLSEHKRHLKTVIEILNKHQVSINYDKSSFLLQEVKYLGQIINGNGIRPDTSRISKLLNYLPANTPKKCQRVIGLLNWFRPYLPNLSQKISEITSKMKLKSGYK
ncbi:POL3 [Hepatospora eriocheir]|uniref:POL3 n=1 Tax=Hepatospora eriocheir TaxID=1081669 RepID=A0A1X0QIF0_9MICR|nr:POL3 [Hepatospora eriocheir]